MLLDRRQLLERLSIAALGSFSINLGALAAALKARPQGAEFKPTLRRTVAALAETILPKSSTPGAIDVGAPEFIEYMVRHGAGTLPYSAFIAAGCAFETDAARNLGVDFAAADQEPRLAYVTAVDLECYSAPTPNANRGSLLGFVAAVKRLTIIGYYTSDVGAHSELDVQQMPGPFQGAVKVNDDARTFYEDSFGVPLERPKGYLSPHG